MKGRQVSMPELRRMKELADDYALPAGSVAKVVSREFGTVRNANDVRHYLRRYFDFRPSQRAKA